MKDPSPDCWKLGRAKLLLLKLCVTEISMAFLSVILSWTWPERQEFFFGFKLAAINASI